MRKYQYALVIALMALFVACSKDNDPQIEPEPEEEGFLEGTNWVPARAKKVSEYIYLDEKYNVVYVVNLPTPDVGNAVSDGHRPLGFNFDTKSAVLGDRNDETDNTRFTWESTKDWHFYVDGIYDSSFHSDADSDEGEEGKGKVEVVMTPFDELDQVPADLDFVHNANHLGLSEPNTSWGYYYFNNHELKPYKDRTMLFLLKDGRYVKMQVVNLYKDNPDEAPSWRDEQTKSLAPFLNLKYYIQQTAGATDLKTR